MEIEPPRFAFCVTIPEHYSKFAITADDIENNTLISFPFVKKILHYIILKNQ